MLLEAEYCASQIVLTFDFPVPVAPTTAMRGSFAGILAIVVKGRNNLVNDPTITEKPLLFHRILPVSNASLHDSSCGKTVYSWYEWFRLGALF